MGYSSYNGVFSFFFFQIRDSGSPFKNIKDNFTNSLLNSFQVHIYSEEFLFAEKNKTCEVSTN